MQADLRAAVSVTAPPAGRDPSVTIALTHDHVDAAAEAVVIVWDPVRRVVWRNASGTYLGDHITAFRLAYTLRDGRRLAPDAVAASEWAAIRDVEVTLAATVGSAVATRSARVSVGPL